MASLGFKDRTVLLCGIVDLLCKIIQGPDISGLRVRQWQATNQWHGTTQRRNALNSMSS
jgi:hypothetical protein